MIDEDEDIKEWKAERPPIAAREFTERYSKLIQKIVSTQNNAPFSQEQTGHMR